MRKYIKLFLLGFAVSIFVILFEDFKNFDAIKTDAGKILVASFTVSGALAKLGYLILLAILLPFVAIIPLKKKLSDKHISLYSFLSGNTFGFTIASIVGILNAGVELL